MVDDNYSKSRTSTLQLTVLIVYWPCCESFRDFLLLPNPPSAHSGAAALNIGTRMAEDYEIFIVLTHMSPSRGLNDLRGKTNFALSNASQSNARSCRCIVLAFLEQPEKRRCVAMHCLELCCVGHSICKFCKARLARTRRMLRFVISGNFALHMSCTG